MRLTVSRAAAAAVATTLLLSTGCASVQTGVGVRDPHSDPNAINISALDTGQYPTKPRDPLGKAGSREAGALVEARRLTEVVVLPFEVDPRYDHPTADVLPFGAAGELTAKLWRNPAVGAGAENHNLVYGFMTGAKPTNEFVIDITHIVLRFATPQDATAAAADMAKRSEASNDALGYVRRPAPVPNRPDSTAFADQKDGAFKQLTMYTTRGAYVIADMANGTSLDDTMRLVQGMVDKQGPLLDGFQATPVDQLADLPLDPSGLLARTMPLPKNAPKTNLVGVYGPHGILNFETNPQRNQKLFTDNGVTEVGSSFATVYQTRDSTAAGRVADDLTTQVEETNYPKYLPDAPVNGLPTARCLKPTETAGGSAYRYQCVGHVDRYVIEVGGKDVTELHRLLAAQYAMLMAK